MKIFTQTKWILTPAILLATIAASAGERSGQARGMPWGGYWWSMLRGELALGWDDGQGRKEWRTSDVKRFDACLGKPTPSCKKLITELAGAKGRALSPLMKFDLYVSKLNAGGAPMAFSHAARRELDTHYIGDNDQHRFWNSRGYAGKCIGWAMATQDYPEPTRTAELEGIEFTPADIKGLLAAVYNGAQFFVPEELTMGNAFHDRPGEDSPEYYVDVHPHDFTRALLQTLDRGKMLEADLDPGDGVWNHPIYRYDLTWKQKSARVIDVTTRIYYVDDQVGIDEVFSTLAPAARAGDAGDLRTRDYTYELSVPANWSGDLAQATGGRWMGASRDNHPDALILGLEEGWLDSIYEYSGTKMNLDVNFQLLKREKRLTNGRARWQPIVLELLRRYYAE